MPLNLKIDCGRTTPGTIDGYTEDVYFIGGTAFSFAYSSVDTTGIVNPPSVAVYNSIRYITSGQTLIYTIPGLNATAKYKVRCHAVSQNVTDTCNVQCNGNSVSNFAISNGIGGIGKLIEFNSVAPNGSNQIIITMTQVAGSPYFSAIEIIEEVIPTLPYGFTQQGVELFVEAKQMSQANGSNVSLYSDQSAFARHLTADSNYPTFQTNVVGGNAVVRWDGLQSPLRNPAVFKVRCGWIISKYNGGATFPAGNDGYKGLLSDLQFQGILAGSSGSSNFFDFLYDYYEFRSNDRIYPKTNAPAPINSFTLVFFRFWTDILFQGVQLGQDRNFVNRKWNGDVPLLILCSRNFYESDIRARTKAIAAAYGLSLADVYPYQADANGTPETPRQSVNFYDPPEGNRISEVLDDPKLSLNLKFTSRRTAEAREMKAFHKSHYAPALPCIYRNYKMIPPEDIEGYIDSPYELDGANDNYNYSFQFREK